ncbi:MAG: hypothetical protein COA79_03135 [Planctomycetota bacterium]|nr:MAG: hypothetical protein COA79_03135 [Planctomycetota bacterium]
MKSIKRSFSLLEVLAVMGLILLLIGIMVPAIGPMLTNARKGQIMASVRGQLEVAHIIAFDSRNMTRAVFGYDPKGAIIRNEFFRNAVDLDGLAIDALPYIGGSVAEADINGDGVSSQDASTTFFWIQCYLCADKTTVSVATMQAAYAATVGSGTATAQQIADTFIGGPYWMRRPVSRRKVGTTYQNTYFHSESMRILDPDTGTAFFYRPLKNKGLDDGAGAEVMTLDINGRCFLMKDSGGEIDYAALEDDVDTAVGSWWDTYLDSVAIYPTKGGTRYKFVYGKKAKAIADTNYAVIYANEKALNGGSLTADQEDSLYAQFGYEVDIRWYLQLLGASFQTGNDDEDQISEEGMTITVQEYQQFEKNWTVRVPTFVMGDRSIAVNPRSFNGGTPNQNSITDYSTYFNGIPDPTRKLNSELFIGGEDQSGIMLRRVWAVRYGKNKPSLVYRNDKAVVIPAQSDLGNLKAIVISPFYFYVVFDNNNGVTGMSVGSSFGTLEAEILYFQIANDGGDVSGFMQMQNGEMVEGNFDNMGLNKSDYPSYFIGGRD